MNSILDVSNVTMDFGGVRALNQVDLEIFPGETVALIGPNGAGKTTLFNCITGIYNPIYGSIKITSDRGSVTELKGLKPNKITERGIARTFQNIRLFQNMTVLENIMVGRHSRLHSGIAGAVFRGQKTRAEERKVVDDSFRLLEKFRLANYVNEFAKNLPYGAQRRLEIARAMAIEPIVLLLDEPTAGMNLQETKELDEMIVQLRDQEGVSILLIEHDMKLVMSLSNRIVVMDYGEKIAEGTAEEIKNNPIVIKAYLGEDIDA